MDIAESGHGGERRDVAARESRDRLGEWLDINPANLRGLDEPAIDVEAATATAVAELDSLTGVASRLGVDQRLRDEWSRALRYDRPLALVKVDAEHLRAINERHGMHAGDRLLQAVAERLRGSIRQHDLVGRVGGDEFLVICPETPDRGAVQVAARLVAAISADPIPVEGSEVPARINAGWAVTPGHAHLSEFVHAADEALDRARAQARGERDQA